MSDQNPTLEYATAHRPRLTRRRINWPYMMIGIVIVAGLLSFWGFLFWSALGWTAF